MKVKGYKKKHDVGLLPPQKKTLKKMKKDAKGNAPQTAAQTPNEKLKDPNLSSTCAEELWVEIGIFEFFVGHLCSSL